jgi:NitT/TauT family transport system substrate-binding protein
MSDVLGTSPIRPGEAKGLKHSLRRGALRRVVPAALAALLVAVAAGCGSEAAAGGEGEITVSNHPALLYSPPWIAAADQKLFEKHGVHVRKIVGSEGGGTTVQNVVSGGLPIGDVATSAAVTAYLAGADIKIVGGGVAGGEDVFWVTEPGSDIDSIEDLRGKKVGYTSPGSVTQGLLALSLERSGVGLENVETRSMGGLSEGLTALKNGDIDAAAMLEPVYSEQVDEEGWKPIFKASEYVPDFMATVVITGPDVAQKQPDMVRRVLAARAEGIEFVKQHPDQVAKAWAREAEIEPSSALAALKSVDADEHWSVGLGDVKRLDSVLETMRLIDLLGNKQKVDWKGLVDQRFIPARERIELPTSG